MLPFRLPRAFAVAPMIGLLLPFALLPNAGAAQSPAMTGIGSATRDIVSFSYSIQVPDGSTLTGATLITDQDARLPADADSARTVLIDAQRPKVPATSDSTDLTVELGALDAGNHTVTFSVPIIGGAPGTPRPERV